MTNLHATLDQHTYKHYTGITLLGEKIPLESMTTSFVHRKMRFLPKNTTITLTQVFSGVPRLEHYIELTKNNVNDKMFLIKESHSIFKIFEKCTTNIDKPADKNLGLVVMNTDDYLQQCTTHTDYTLKATYRNKSPIPLYSIEVSNIHVRSIYIYSPSPLIHKSQNFMGSPRFTKSTTHCHQ